jgi:hypothetical protein
MMKHLAITSVSRLAVLAVSLLRIGAAQAQTWNLPTGGEWNLAGNWNPATIPNSDSAAVTLGNTITGPSTITVNGPAQILTLALDSVHGYTLLDTDLSFANAANRAITVAAGNLGDHALSFNFTGTPTLR